MAILYVMCGVQGAGKSYIAGKIAEAANATIVSRDAIRFSLLKDGEDYFAHETDVLKIFYDSINELLEKGENVVADSTLVSPKARREFIKHIQIRDYVIAVAVEAPFQQCIARNRQREGRKKVPEIAITSAYDNYLRPICEEGFNEVRVIEN